MCFFGALGWLPRFDRVSEFRVRVSEFETSRHPVGTHPKPIAKKFEIPALNIPSTVSKSVYLHCHIPGSPRERDLQK